MRAMTTKEGFVKGPEAKVDVGGESGDEEYYVSTCGASCTDRLHMYCLIISQSSIVVLKIGIDRFYSPFSSPVLLLKKMVNFMTKIHNILLEFFETCEITTVLRSTK